MFNYALPLGQVVLGIRATYSAYLKNRLSPLAKPGSSCLSLTQPGQADPAQSLLLPCRGALYLFIAGQRKRGHLTFWKYLQRRSGWDVWGHTQREKV